MPTRLAWSISSSACVCASLVTAASLVSCAASALASRRISSACSRASAGSSPGPGRPGWPPGSPGAPPRASRRPWPELIRIQQDLAGERHPGGLLNQLFQPVDESHDLHGANLPAVRVDVLAELFPEPPCGERRHQPLRRAAEVGQFPHDARGEVCVLDAAHEEARLDVLVQLPVHGAHLPFVFEVLNRPESLHDDPAPLLAGEVHQQAARGRHGDIGDVLGSLPQHLQPLLHGEERRLAGVGQHRHDHLVEGAGGPLDDIEMSERHGIEAPGTDCLDHEFCPPASRAVSPIDG